MATYVERLELNSAGIRELLRSGGVQADLNRRAAAVAQSAGDGFQMRSTPRATRGRAEAVAATYAARLNPGRLISAIGAARR